MKMFRNKLLLTCDLFECTDERSFATFAMCGLTLEKLSALKIDIPDSQNNPLTNSAFLLCYCNISAKNLMEHNSQKYMNP